MKLPKMPPFLSKLTQKAKNLKTEQVLPYAIAIVVIVVAVVLVKKFGKKNAETKSNASDFLNALLNLDGKNVASTAGGYPPGSQPIAHNSAVFLAKKILAAWGAFDDDEEKIYSTIDQMATLPQVQHVNRVYAQLTKGVNMMRDMENRLSAEEYKKVLELINSKPVK